MSTRHLGWFLGASLLSSGAHAFEVNRFEPALWSGGLLVSEGARTSKTFELSSALWLHHAKAPLVLENQRGAVVLEPVERLTRASLTLALAFPGRLSLGVDMPFVLAARGQDTSGQDFRGAGVADPRLSLKTAIVGREGDGVGVALALPVTVPLGDASRYQGADEPTVSPTLVLDGGFGATTVLLNLAYRLRPDERYMDLALEDELKGSLGVGVALPASLTLMGELFGVTPAASPFADDGRTALEGVAGLRWQVAPCVGLTGGGGGGLIQGVGAPEARFFAAVSYGGCPSAPEASVVPDDADGDGLVNALDLCPAEPEDRDGFKDQDGCPDLDNDEDGVPDTMDRCATAPEDRDGRQDEDGCPDPDDDGDGIVDAADRCPTQAEDKDDYRDEDGCPDLDNDGDGLADAVDQCPLQREDLDGDADEDGCPEEAKTAAVGRAELKGGYILSDPVTFEAGGVVLTEAGAKALDDVARLLNARPDLTLVRVEGHTDSQGDAEVNQTLSERRAAEVVSFLVELGVARSRLVSAGFGESSPIESNARPEGRALNRRIEFKVL